MNAKFSLSKITVVIILLMAFLTIGKEEKWTTEQGYTFNDAAGYYAYLPALFIYDFDLEEFEKRIGVKRNPENGKLFTKYTSGNAYCYLPGFLLAHGAAHMGPWKTDGYSLPYQFAFALTALVFLWMTLLLGRKILLQLYEEKVVAICLLIFFLGSNYFYYATSYLSYSHLFSVFFILLYIRSIQLCLEEFNWNKALLFGFSAGMMTLIRPVDGLLIFLPLFLFNEGAFKERIGYLWMHKKYILGTVLIAVLVWVPQLTYNYYVFENITINTYLEESFFFTDPEMWKVLFSFNNGWLIYSPLMAFGIIGLVVKFLQRERFWAVFFLIYLFVISSWWCWWYVGFGNRGMVNIGAFLLIPMGAGIQLLVKKKVTHYGLIVVVILGVTLNLYQSRQFEKGTIHYEGMNWETYKSVWLEEGTTLEFYDQLEPLDGEYALKGIDATYKKYFDTIGQEEFVKNGPITISNSPYFGEFKTETKSCNTLVAEARVGKDIDSLTIFCAPFGSECNIQPFGVTRTRKEKYDFIIRSYFRYNDTIPPCDSVMYFFANPKEKTAQLKSFKVWFLNKKEKLLFKE